MFKYTTAIKKIRAMKARKKVIQGGTSAGKTYGIIPVLIDRAARESRIKVTVVAETLPALKEGAVDVFKEIMIETNRWIDANWNASSLIYTFSGSGSRIQFKSYDTAGKAKGARRDILFLNEANHIKYEIADALMIRSKETYIDFNPDNKFWAHEEVLKEPNSEFLLLTYEDNEGLAKETLEDLLIKKSKAFKDPNLLAPKLTQEDNILNAYWANWCRVYLFGEIGKLEGVIFENWNFGEFNESLPNWIGLDFGFVNDPDACARVAIDEPNKKIYVDELFYRKGQTIDMLSEKVKGLPKGSIIADSAEQRLISYLRTSSKRSIIEAKKGAGSVMQGVKLLQNYEIIVTESSLNFVHELRHYKWNNKTKTEPIDSFNHLMDAVRYVVFMNSNISNPTQPNYETEHTRFLKGDSTGFNASPWNADRKETSGNFF